MVGKVRVLSPAPHLVQHVSHERGLAGVDVSHNDQVDQLLHVRLLLPFASRRRWGRSDRRKLIQPEEGRGK